MATMSHGPERNRLIRQIITSIRCAVCQQHYDGDDVRLLGRRDELWVMRVVCENCSTQGLVFALIKDGQSQVQDHQVLTELSRVEEERFEELPPVGMDDVLDVRRLLEDSEEDLESFLEAIQS